MAQLIVLPGVMATAPTVMAVRASKASLPVRPRDGGPDYAKTYGGLQPDQYPPIRP